jgi:hypothetical protein
MCSPLQDQDKGVVVLLVTPWIMHFIQSLFDFLHMGGYCIGQHLLSFAMLLCNAVRIQLHIKSEIDVEMQLQYK